MPPCASLAFSLVASGVWTDGLAQFPCQHTTDRATRLSSLERSVELRLWASANRALTDGTEDILHVRLQTIGVTEHQFDINLGGTHYNWLLYDVGGAVRSLSFPRRLRVTLTMSVFSGARWVGEDSHAVSSRD